MHPTSDGLIFGGKWWRFDRYEVKKGYIRPVKGSPLRSYDPWKEYRAPHGKEARKQPYHSLLELISTINIGGELTQVEEDLKDLLIAEWCGRHGLLGVVVPYLVWEHPTPQLAVLSFGSAMTAADLREHGERVDTFLLGARFLSELIEALQAVGKSNKSPKQKQIDFDEATRWSRLNLLSSIQPEVFIAANGHCGLRWNCASLIGNFAMMAILDFEHHRPMICQNSSCGKLFTTKSIQAKYCSGRCRDTVQMREYRKRKKEL
jgi:hypothetical protein